MLFQKNGKANQSKMPQDIFVLFSGHNDRAVITLCRFFAAHDLPFAVVSASRADAIAQADWSAKCIISRVDHKLDIPLFETVVQAIRVAHGASARPVYCPTTEFMNHFVLQERTSLLQLGWSFTLPTFEIYAALTSKASSQAIVKQLIGVPAPPELPWTNLRAPCVLKPYSNVDQNKVNYPRLCRTDDELKQALNDINPKHWFAQAWVEGQSYYLCAYLSRKGNHAHFWQQNLLQQPGGKSIVLARSVSNPGIFTEPLFQGLFDLGYYGPFMMEVIRDDDGHFYYIEINPRFWGPLQLALDKCPEILRLFVDDAGIEVDVDTNLIGVESEDTHWYAWQRGAQTEGCRSYPALAHVETSLTLAELLDRWDVYARPDTQSLHGRY